MYPKLNDMYTVLLIKDKQEIKILSQQYVCGTYVTINGMQTGTTEKEDIYHKKLRIKAIKLGDTITGGSVIDLKSKFPINTFVSN